MLKVSQLLEFYRTGHWKLKMGCALPFEYELCWTAFLVSRTPQMWISRGKRPKNDFQGQSTVLRLVKIVLPHTFQIWRHQLLAVLFLLDWSTMRNIYGVFKFLQCGCTNLLNIILLVICFSVALKKRQKIWDLTFWTNLVSIGLLWNSHSILIQRFSMAYRNFTWLGKSKEKLSPSKKRIINVFAFTLGCGKCKTKHYIFLLFFCQF